MIVIHTDRLLIRNFSVGDAEPLWNIRQQCEASEYGSYDYQWPAALSDYAAIVESFASSDRFLAICLHDSGRVIGLVSLHKPGDADGKYDLGYCFDFAYHGHGYATEACRAVLGHAFTTLRALRVTSGTAAANLPSWRLLERLGFHKTGSDMVSFRQAADGTLLEFEGWTYVLARADWDAP